ncbi:hypothetical protein ACF0H5_008969 [Mactra antiquata]
MIGGMNYDLKIQFGQQKQFVNEQLTPMLGVRKRGKCVGKLCGIQGKEIAKKQFTRQKPAENKYQLKIICMVLNRAESMLRLLNSLNEADYEGDKVITNVWIDRYENGSFDSHTFNTVSQFNFRHGTYIVNLHEQHVGLYGQWLTTFDVTKSTPFDIVVFFEDDVTVSPHFYKYLKIVHAKYDSRPEINGYALQGIRQHLGDGMTGFVEPPPDVPIYKYPSLTTWGFSPNIPNWKKFIKWYNVVKNDKTFHPYIPRHKSLRWYKWHERKNRTHELWTTWHMYHAWNKGEYTMFSNFPGHNGLAAHMKECGLHHKFCLTAEITPLLEHWDYNFASKLPDHPIIIDIFGKVHEENQQSNPTFKENDKD